MREELYRRVGQSKCAQCGHPLTAEDGWWIVGVIPEGQDEETEKVLICQDCFDKMLEAAGGILDELPST